MQVNKNTSDIIWTVVKNMENLMLNTKALIFLLIY